MGTLVGYLRREQRADGPALVGTRGSFYTYVLAGNGVFVEAQGDLVAARLQLARCEVRGLAPLESRVVLVHGKIPRHLFSLALDIMLADLTREVYVAVVWDGQRYRLWRPEQAQGQARVEYVRHPGTVLDMHSHRHMGAYFSQTDDADETGFQCYGVVGDMPRSPAVQFRAGVYGHHQTVRWEDLFDGACPIIDVAAVPLEDFEFGGEYVPTTT